MAVTRIGVIGAGQMGNGIAHVAASNGWPVAVQDVSVASLEKARQTIEGNLGRQVKKGAMTVEAASAALALL